MKDFNKAIIERIKLLRRKFAGNRGKSKFARALGISPSSYNYYENDRIPPIEVLLRISEVAGADLHWLITGRENKKIFAFGQNQATLQKLDELLTENPELTEALLAFTELLSEKKGIERRLRPNVSDKPSRLGWIPVLGRTAAGMVHFWDQTFLPEPRQAVTELEELVKRHTGKTILSSQQTTVTVDLQARALAEAIKNCQVSLVQVDDSEHNQIVEFVKCEDLYKLFPDSFALHIDGDSMSPRINDGDIVIISPSVPAAQGLIGIARLANQIGVTCKLIRTSEAEAHLIPINEKYETKVVPRKDLLWALAVLCHVKL